MKYVLSQEIDPAGMALLSTDDELFIAGDSNPERYIDQLQKADCFVARFVRFREKEIRQCENLKVIGRLGVGYDTVDVNVATQLGIPVVITPGANKRGVAEHVAAMILSLSKNLYESQQEMGRGNWDVRFNGKIFELKGATLGLIGLGAIGKEVAMLCAGIGMKVVGYDPHADKAAITAAGIDYYSDYRQLLKVSDVVSVHVPLTNDTRNLIGRDELRLMKPTAMIINCSRGGIINEKSLCDALDQGVIRCAGLDVFESEPLSPESVLFRTKNLLLTPHTAGASNESFSRVAISCIKGCQAICRGERWPNVADPQVYNHPRWQG